MHKSFSFVSLSELQTNTLEVLLQVKAYGPGLEGTGCIVNNPAEFTVETKDAGKAPLKMYAQVKTQRAAV